MAYLPETNSAIIDAKLIMDKVLYNDDYYTTLGPCGIARDDIRSVWEQLENIVYENKIPYDAESGMANEYPAEHWTQTDDTLKAVRDRLDGIDDPEFWYEQEHAMNYIMEIFNTKCGIDY